MHPTVSPVSEEEGSEEEKGEEVIIAKRWKRGKTQPSAEEIRRHMISHIPFRSWCEHCVKGRAKDAPHYRVTASDIDTEPVLTWDYMWMKKAKDNSRDTAGGDTGEDIEQLDTKPILVSKDRASKWVSAHVVRRKGDDPFTIKRISQDVGNAGYARLTLKNDQENSLQGVLEKVKMERGEDILVEASPAYDKQSKGEVEQVVQEVQGQVRTMRLSLENRIGATIEKVGDFWPWMVRHAAILLNIYIEEETMAVRRGNVVRGGPLRETCLSLEEGYTISDQALWGPKSMSPGGTLVCSLVCERSQVSGSSEPRMEY